MYPDAHCELDFTTPLELLVATILSAQCTDRRVNKVTPVLFARYRSAADYASANQEELENIIRSTGFYRTKARNIIALGQRLCDEHGGEVPDRLEDLVKLPGVGRKTANVVLGNAFGQNVGIVVDTHVQRLSRRLGLTEQTDAEKIERDLLPLVPQDDWTLWSHLLIDHGRKICKARKPECPICPVADLCPSAEV